MQPSMSSTRSLPSRGNLGSGAARDGDDLARLAGGASLAARSIVPLCISSSPMGCSRAELRASILEVIVMNVYGFKPTTARRTFFRGFSRNDPSLAFAPSFRARFSKTKIGGGAQCAMVMGTKTTEKLGCAPSWITALIRTSIS